MNEKGMKENGDGKEKCNLKTGNEKNKRKEGIK